MIPSGKEDSVSQDADERKKTSYSLSFVSSIFLTFAMLHSPVIHRKIPLYVTLPSLYKTFIKEIVELINYFLT